MMSSLEKPQLVPARAFRICKEPVALVAMAMALEGRCVARRLSVAETALIKNEEGQQDCAAHLTRWRLQQQQQDSNDPANVRPIDSPLERSHTVAINTNAKQVGSETHK
jgi:hypothetical protein